MEFMQKSFNWCCCRGGRLYLSNLNCVFCFYFKSILFTAMSCLFGPELDLILKTVSFFFEWCRSWTLADCGLHGAAYPSRSADSVLLPPDNFPRCLSNVSAVARPGLALSLHDLSAAFDRRYLPLKLLTNCFSSALLSFFFYRQLRRNLMCNTILTVQQVLEAEVKISVF